MQRRHAAGPGHRLFQRRGKLQHEMIHRRRGRDLHADRQAVGVLRQLREAGLRVPEDVSVTGFDNLRLSQFCFPALTTVHIPREQIGRIAFECLQSKPHRTHSAGRSLIIDPEFIVRDSTGPVAANRVFAETSYDQR